MNRKLFVLAFVVCFAVPILPVQTLSGANGQEKADPPNWKFKAVHFTSDEKEGSQKLNDLAEAGWQYVGPLANGLVAFRRPAYPKDQIVVDVAASPKTVAPGEKTTITVTVRAGDEGLLPGAKVTISAGGGKFLPAADTPFEPKDRLHSPYSATGTTDDKGQFTTWWVVNPAAPGYGLNVDVSKAGYTSSKANLLIKIKMEANQIFP